MQSKERTQIKFDVNNGAPDLRLKAAEEAIPVLRQELRRMSDKAMSQCREFAATLAAWTSSEVGESLRPVGIEQDLRDARMINLIAVFLTLTELLLTVVVSLVFLVSAPFLFLVALVSIFALKVGLLALWRNPQQPQQTRQRLRRYVIAPSLVVTMLALGALVFARTAGVLALLLLPLINLALCALSLGCLGLAAGLFALGFLMSWSRHAEKQFNALEREAVETGKVLQRVEKVAEELRAAKLNRAPAQTVQTVQVDAPGVSPLPAPRVSTAPVAMTQTVQAVRRNGSLLSVLIVALAMGSGGCNVSGGLGQMVNPSGVAAAPTSSPAVVAEKAPAFSPGPAQGAQLDEPVWLELWLDWSLSAEDEPYREAVRALLAALPELAMKHRLAHVTAHQFGAHGWNAPEIFNLDLPLPPAVELDEAGALFGGAKKQQVEQAEQQRLTQLRQKLAALTAERLLPLNAIEPPCTDVQGCLNRMAVSARPQRRLVFLISDFDDSCSHRLPSVSLAAANAALVAVILPEAQPVSAHGEPLRPDQLWMQRRDELMKAVPGAVVIPYFGDPLSAASAALSKLGKQPHHDDALKP